MSDRVTVSTDGHVAEVMLNRPDKHNAIDMQMFAELGEAGDRLAAEPAIRAVVLHSAGDNFCAGIDVGVFDDNTASIGPNSMAPQGPSPANFFQRAAYVWRELPVPVICAISGVAFGGGLQIALGADLRYARPDSRLSIMEIKWGLIPDMAISATARHVMPVDKLKELAYSGRVVDGKEALQLGLLTALHEDPLMAAREMAAEIAAKSPDAVAAMKKLFNSGWDLPESESLALEAALQSRLMGSENQLEAAQANLNKRSPEFKD
ncbi:MAG: crotonase/enoyl-CoA hydratase family protein [Woeseiaceae bacterium]